MHFPHRKPNAAYIYTTNRSSGYRDSVSYCCTKILRKRVFVFSYLVCFLYEQELGRALKNNRGLRDSNSQLAIQVKLDITTLRKEASLDAA